MDIKVKMAKDKYKLVEGDVGLFEDLLFGLKNMVGLEEHLQNSYDSSKDKKYAKILEVVRKLRTKYSSLTKKDFKFQEWCIQKHALASSMSLQELGNRFLSTSQEDEALDCFNDSNTFLKIIMLLNDVEEGGVKSSA